MTAASGEFRGLWGRAVPPERRPGPLFSTSSSRAFHLAFRLPVPGSESPDIWTEVESRPDSDSPPPTKQDVSSAVLHVVGNNRPLTPQSCSGVTHSI